MILWDLANSTTPIDCGFGSALTGVYAGLHDFGTVARNEKISNDWLDTQYRPKSFLCICDQGLDIRLVCE
jgi:hypothetical protein